MYYYNYNDDEISHDEISHVHVHVDPLTSYLLTYSTLSCASCIFSTSCASVAATPTCTGSGANNRGTECATSALLFDGIARGGARTVLTHGAPLPQPIEYGAVARREGLEVLGWQSVCRNSGPEKQRVRLFTSSTPRHIQSVQAGRPHYRPCFRHRWQRALRIGAAAAEEAARQRLEHVTRDEAEPRELGARVAVEASVRRAVFVH